MPEWLQTLLAAPSRDEGTSFDIGGQPCIIVDGIPRCRTTISAAQQQTRDAFGFKWNKRDTFESATSLARMREWLLSRYGDIAAAAWIREYGPLPLVVDAGCGAGMSAMELFGPTLRDVRYLGVDISTTIEVARQRFAERALPGGFLQADITNLPLAAESVDVIFSEGVLHHTNSTEAALKSLARLLKPGGRFLFYVYRRKGPLREFTDDYVRARLQSLSAEDAWRAMEPLTHLGIALGELDATVDVPEPVDLLGIPAGRVSVQRLFYWHVAKMFYRSDLSFDEMNHINFDWYAPANAHRQSPDDVRGWCAETGLVIEREAIEDAGITVVARKEAASICAG